MAALLQNAVVTSRAVYVPEASLDKRSATVLASVISSSRADRMPDRLGMSRSSSRLACSSSGYCSVFVMDSGSLHASGIRDWLFFCLAATMVCQSEFVEPMFDGLLEALFDQRTLIYDLCLHGGDIMAIIMNFNSLESWDLCNVQLLQR